jgi:hypothetical protein
MSAAANCDCRCPTPEVVDVPGVEGAPGTNGTNGQDGVSAFTFTTADFVVPAISATVAVDVANTSWMVEGQQIFIKGAGAFGVTTINSSTNVLLTYLDYTGNTHATDNIASGAGVTPTGTQAPLAGALPTAFTDNSGGTQSNVVAAGVGIYQLAFYIDAATIANGDLLTNYIPGHNFKILKVDARCAKPVTTGGKASSINMEINTTNLTGGVIPLNGTYALGAAQDGTAVTANNVGSDTDSFSIEASSTTAFIEGAFWIIVSIQNTDDGNAFASLAKHVNDLITALT